MLSLPKSPSSYGHVQTKYVAEEDDIENDFLEDMIIIPEGLLFPGHDSGETTSVPPNLGTEFFVDMKDKDEEKAAMKGEEGSVSSGIGMVKGKKAITAETIAEIGLTDPKRAKRILANREASARSKEKKIRYVKDMEMKVETLQTHSTTLTAELSLLQRNASCLTAKNSALKKCIESLEQQTKLKNDLKDVLKKETNRLKKKTQNLVDKNRTSDTRQTEPTITMLNHNA
ncbi:hypothetical protein vseg_017541 [Gypsophila vaccaria]